MCTYIQYIPWNITQPKKGNEIKPFTATWMDLEMIIRSEVRQRKTISSDITYVQNLKQDTNELIYETETDSQTENRTVVAREEGTIRSLGLADAN